MHLPATPRKSTANADRPVTRVTICPFLHV
jgi:hypothetical protein